MSEPVFECPSEWTNDCGCPDAHNSCWPEPITSCCPELQITPETPADQVAIIEQSKRIAVALLNSFTGRQFGLCPRIVRPCRDTCTQPVGTEWVDGQLRPTLYSGVWINDTCGQCRSGCSCSAISEVTLPGPVYSIVEIRIDGQVLSPLDYRVDNRRKLVAQGDFQWPTCQNMSLPAGDVGTWTVEYQRGLPVPEAGRWASGLLACEFIKLCNPATAGECRLPDNVRSVAREGVTLELEPFIVGGADGPVEFGRTGIPEVDLWIQSVNPYKLRSRSRVYSPDRPPPRRTTWPCP